MNKKCVKCGEEKAEYEFYDSRDNKRPTCIKCSPKPPKKKKR